jgi:hypothetical protein
MSARNDWAHGLLDLYAIWCAAMDKARAAGLSDDEAADAVGSWLRGQLDGSGVAR